MKKIIITGLFFIALAGCQEDDAGTAENNDPIVNDPVTIEFEELYKHNQAFGDEDAAPGNFVFNDENTWNAWREGIASHAAHPELNDDIMAISVDFSAYTVIVVVDKLRYSGGFDIWVASVVQESEAITIAVETIAPDPGEYVTDVLTQPFHIVKIPITALPITFE